MSSYVLSVIVLAAALMPLRAQEDAPPVVRGVEATLLPEIESRLRSADTGTVAWGAHLAARYHVAAAVPELRAKLATFAVTPDQELKFAVLALLEALVQTNAVVPLAELRPFLRGLSRTPALVLLARDLDTNRDYFITEFRRLAGDGAWTEWLACGNLLASVKDAAFALDVLRSVDVTLHVLVRDPDDETFGGSGGSGGSSFRSADGKLDVPEHHPPTVLYSLSRRGRPGDVLFAAGTKPVYLRRVVRSERQFGIGESDGLRNGEQRETHIEWLAELLDKPVILLPLDFEQRTVIDWRGPDAFTVSMRETHARIAADHAKLVDLCVETRLLMREAVTGLRPAVDVKLRDVRKDKTVPLPEQSPTAK